MSNSSNHVPQLNTFTDDVMGAKAIEVAAMLGDSVVDVKHCIDPHSGKVTSKTWGLFAAGIACVLLSAVAFFVSVRTAANNKARLDYWTHVAKKPPAAFRAEQLSFGYDWAAFGGLVLGVGALAGALSRMRREKRTPYYRIGTAPDVQQAVVGAPAESFALVAPRGDDFVFNFGAGVSGDMVVDGKTTALAELAASGRAQPSASQPGAFELPIPMHARIRANVGMTSFMVSAVAKPREQQTAFLAGLESKTMAYFAGSLAAHLGLVLLLAQIPVESGTAAIDLATLELTEIRSSSETKEDVTPEVEKDVGGGGEEAANATAMALESGEAGDPTKQVQPSHIRIKQNAEEAATARIQAINEARTAGVLGSVALQSGDAFASLTSMSNISSGFDDANVYGALFGAEGSGHGYFGYGRSGFGAGGGCTQEPCGIIGTGNGYNKIGLGKYGREGYAGPGGGGGGLRKHEAGVPVPVIGQPTGSGNLDKSIIRRYIKRNIEKIGYCYEKQLLAKPGLDGTVTVSFFITPTGSVKSSSGSGMDATVANCVADVVGHIEFPRPSDGGVQVNYPFTFHPAGN